MNANPTIWIIFSAVEKNAAGDLKDAYSVNDAAAGCGFANGAVYIRAHNTMIVDGFVFQIFESSQFTDTCHDINIKLIRT